MLPGPSLLSSGVPWGPPQLQVLWAAEGRHLRGEPQRTRLLTLELLRENQLLLLPPAARYIVDLAGRLDSSSNSRLVPLDL